MRITAIALGLVLGVTVPLAAQEPAPDAPREGIKVHGHWMIEVVNPDGSIASHVEFENALQLTGRQLLSTFLARKGSPGQWSIRLEGSPQPCGGGSFVGPDDQSPRTPGSCYLTESGTDPQTFAVWNGSAFVPGTNVSRNLVVNGPYVGDPNPSPSVKLRGSVTALAAGTITTVWTSLGGCFTAEPVGCPRAYSGFAGYEGANNGLAFSSTSLPSPLTVDAERLIQVTVVFTFA